MHQSVADPKYEGVRTSRKELIENEDNSGEDDEESYHEEDEESEEGRVRFDVPSEDEEDHSGEDEESHHDEDEEESEEGRVRFDLPPEKQKNLGPTEDVTLTLKKKREEDLEKGQAVKRQVVRPFCLRDSVCAG